MPVIFSISAWVRNHCLILVNITKIMSMSWPWHDADRKAVSVELNVVRQLDMLPAVIRSPGLHLVLTRAVWPVGVGDGLQDFFVRQRETWR